MSSSYLMAIDCGSGSVKCFIVDTKGKIISQASVEWDRNAWDTKVGWNSIKRAIRKTLTYPGIEPDQVLAVSTTSMREEFVLLDKQEQEITYKIEPDIYTHGDNLNNNFGERIYRASGHWPVPGWMAAAKLAWLTDRHHEIINRINLFLTISDWAGYLLGGVPYTEASSACETSLFNIAKGDWCWEILTDLKLPRSIFPKVEKNGVQISQITSKAAKGTSLLEGTPVVVGGADTQCGLLGCGAINKGDVVAVGGTTTPVQMVTEKPVFDAKGRTWTNSHVAQRRWVIESNAGRTGWVYRWFRDNILCEKPSNKIYDSINTLAQTSPPGSNGVNIFFGPHVFNSGPPYLDGDRLGDIPVPPTILGSSNFKRGDLARAIIEANCFAVRANLEQLKEITGTDVKELGFCGGNSKSKLWNEIQAAVIDKPVIVPKERDASAIGVAICAAVGAGIYRNIPQATKAMIHLEEPVIATNELSSRYDSLYRSWMKTRRHLSGIL